MLQDFGKYKITDYLRWLNFAPKLLSNQKKSLKQCCILFGEHAVAILLLNISMTK